MVADTIRNALWRLLGVCALCALAAGCMAGDASDVTTFLLRNEQVDVRAAAGQVRDALAAELRAGGLLKSPYPVVGHVTTTSDPSDPNVGFMRCTEGWSDDPEETGCILLDPGGDFVRVMSITWQSAAFYRYRVYVSPRSLLAKVDPTKDFVAMDVFLEQDPGLWDDTDQAIRRAAQDLGAQPFQP
jgi:hypothetical protein